MYSSFELFVVKISFYFINEMANFSRYEQTNDIQTVHFYQPVLILIGLISNILALIVMLNENFLLHFYKQVKDLKYLNNKDWEI